MSLMHLWQSASWLKAHSPAGELHSEGDASKSTGLLSAVIHAGEAGEAARPTQHGTGQKLNTGL